MPDSTSKKLVWDQVGEKFYETGVDLGVLYPMADGAYGEGEAWNGLMSVDEKPSGAEPTPLYANNKKYLELLSAEDFAMTIGAYTFPAGFRQCLGVKEIAPGVYVGQQVHVPFGMTYRTLIGNDTKKNAYGYKVHIVYGATAKPSEKSNKTVNESPEAAEMSWECTTTPIEIPGFEPAAHIEIDSTTVTESVLKSIEDMLYGTENTAAKLPTPAELIALLNPGT
jgi:hypothetical protein